MISIRLSRSGIDAVVESCEDSAGIGRVMTTKLGTILQAVMEQDMTECATLSQELGVKWVNLRGRIDSLTSPEIQDRIDQLIHGGERTVVINLEETSFISSVGVRIIIDTYERLVKVGGQMILYNVSGNVQDVLVLSGIMGSVVTAASGTRSNPY
jgi:anti-sigma B factor antagonist